MCHYGRGVKLKTVEIVVDEKPLRHPRFQSEDFVPVNVGYHEQELRELLLDRNTFIHKTTF